MQIHRHEFEEHFGFGSHCENYNPNKKIIYCPKFQIMSFDELISKMNTSTITEDTIKELCLLMILGGYWNKKQAITDLLNFSQSEFGINEIISDQIYKYLFHKIEEVINQN